MLNKIKNRLKQIKINYKRVKFTNWIKANTNGKNISFISQNCISGRFYKLLERPYFSPTVGLWFEPEDFLSFVENLHINLTSEVHHDIDESKIYSYPVGRVNGVKIHFMHYESFEYAKKKWNDRAKRVDPANVVILMTDRDGCSASHKERFFSLPFEKKALFSHLPSRSDSSEIYVPGFENESSVGNLYGNYESFHSRPVMKALAKLLN